MRRISRYPTPAGIADSKRGAPRQRLGNSRPPSGLAQPSAFGRLSLRGDESLTNTSYPVARRGCLVRTADKRTDEQKTLSLADGEVALKLIAARAAGFLEAIKFGIEEGAAQLGVRLEWPEADDKRLRGLSPARRSRAQGPIYDFDEFAFFLDGALIIARGCVTLCVSSHKKDSTDKIKPFYSKFWMRFILATHPESLAEDQRALDLSAKVLSEFDERCGVLSSPVMSAIAKLYAEAVTAATGVEVYVDPTGNGSFSILAVGASTNDFTELFEATNSGERLSDEMKKDGAISAVQLVELAFCVFKIEQPDRFGEVDLRAQLGEDCDLVIYDDDVDAKRGVFISKIQNKEARFVGLTRIPLRSGQNAKSASKVAFGQLHEASANVVSGGLVTQYASRF